MVALRSALDPSSCEILALITRGGAWTYHALRMSHVKCSVFGPIGNVFVILKRPDITVFGLRKDDVVCRISVVF
jgi:hypothetical protein